MPRIRNIRAAVSRAPVSRTRKVKRQVFPPDACLDKLDRPAWGPAPADATPLIRRCHELRTKPLDKFTVEDLRTMIEQRIGLLYLTPLALRVLKANPWAAGDFYEGDLLATVLRINPEFWMVNYDWAFELQAIVDELGPVPSDELGPVLTDDLADYVRRPIADLADTIMIIEKQLRRGPVA